MTWRWAPVWRSALPLTVDPKLIWSESGYAGVDDVEHTIRVELNLEF